MTDQEIVRLAAERVMKWPYIERAEERDSMKVQYPHLDGDGDLRTGTYRGRKWNPLTNNSDSLMLVDKLVSDETRVWITGSSNGWEASFSIMRSESDGHKYWVDFEHKDPDRRRAIVIAALKAVGVDVS